MSTEIILELVSPAPIFLEHLKHILNTKLNPNQQAGRLSELPTEQCATAAVFYGRPQEPPGTVGQDRRAGLRRGVLLTRRRFSLFYRIFVGVKQEGRPLRRPSGKLSSFSMSGPLNLISSVSKRNEGSTPRTQPRAERRELYTLRLQPLFQPGP
jgi:hypothetical protein